jgi:hypothetical protein
MSAPLPEGMANDRARRLSEQVAAADRQKGPQVSEGNISGSVGLRADLTKAPLFLMPTPGEGSCPANR